MRTEIILVLDSSGSMASIQDAVQSGYDEFMQTQLQASLADPENTAFVSLIEFSDNVRVVYEGVPITDVPKLQLRPNGMTALRDGIGVAISNARTRFASLEAVPELVILMVITDGQENSSREITVENVNSLLKGVRDEGWTLQFLGADESAIHWAQSVGFSPNSTVQIAATPAAARASFSALGKGVTRSRGAYLEAAAEVKTAGGVYDPMAVRMCVSDSVGIGSVMTQEDYQAELGTSNDLTPAVAKIGTGTAKVTPAVAVRVNKT